MVTAADGAGSERDPSREGKQDPPGNRPPDTHLPPAPGPALARAGVYVRFVRQEGQG